MCTQTFSTLCLQLYASPLGEVAKAVHFRTGKAFLLLGIFLLKEFLVMY